MKIIKYIILMRQLLFNANADLIGINRYQNTIQNHNTGLQEICIENTKTALENALLKQYYSFLTASKSIKTKTDNTANTNETFAELKTVVKRTFRRNQYFKNMQSDWIKGYLTKNLFSTKVTWDDP